MGLFSFLQRSAPAGDAESLEGLRRRARRRLIGAALLVLVGVVVLPLFLDTAPRPVAVDIPIDIPSKDKAPLLPAAGKPVASGKLASASMPVAAPKVEPNVAVEPAVTASAEKPTVAPGERPAELPAEPPAPRAIDKPVPVAAEKAAAVPAKTPTPAVMRYVVQVGAYSEAASAREARQRVEKLGLKTYTQVVETAAGARTRVRVGPFDDRADADRTASRIKQAGLPAAVLGL
ncbi:MAG TPA: SPOR domain-containing protein [Methylibium sp.]|nr:SPOR domain-containing protein [Methylibium sp.]